MGGPNNENGNPNIAEIGKDTHFGQPSNDANAAQKKANKPWSVRHNVKFFARQEWETGKGAESMEEQAKKILDKKKLTGAEMMALARVRQAMLAHPKFSQYCVEDIDGKLVEKKVTSQISLADLINGKFDKAEDDEE